MQPIQCRMARAGLGISAAELADAASVAVNTVSRYEGGQDSRQSTVAALKAALESKGVTFLPDDGSGLGVRVVNPHD